MRSCIANADKVCTYYCPSQDARVVTQSFREHKHSTTMRAGLLTIGYATLLQLATSQGHGIRLPKSASGKQNTDSVRTEHLKHHHAKRQEVCSDVVTNVVTDIDYVTYDSEDIIVYVNDANQPVSTTTVYKGLVPHTQGPTASTPPAPVSESPSSPPAPPPESPSSTLVAPKPELEPSTPAPAPVPVPQPTEAEAPASSPDSSPSPSSEESGSSGPGFSSAIAYTPYNADQSCKSTSQVAADFQKISGYEVIRLYGTDCNQISNVIAATHSSVKLLLGIFDLNSIQSEVQIMSSVWLISALFCHIIYPILSRKKCSGSSTFVSQIDVILKKKG